jgi:hypothetical protein
MENQSPKTMTKSYEIFLLFIQEYEIDINDFYSVNVSKYGTNFQGNYNSKLVKKLQENTFFTICKVNGYLESTFIYLDFEIKIILT